MATSNFEREQDAKAAEIGITIERRKVDVPTLNYKGLQRKEKEKAVLLNQKIKLLLFDNLGKVQDGCEFRVVRKKLTPKTLQDLISRSPVSGSRLPACLPLFVVRVTGRSRKSHREAGVRAACDVARPHPAG
jgi:hypothetical protein